MRLSGSCLAALAALVIAPLGGCDARSLVPDAGGGACDVTDTLLSDFEDLAAAVIVRGGCPNREGFGYWYAYNDASATCVQRPAVGDRYLPEVPPMPVPPLNGLTSGSMSLHASWNGCTIWGAGVGADLDAPAAPDGGVYTGHKVPYDLSAYSGIVVFAMATPSTDTHLRLRLPMRATTRIEDGGLCDEAVIGTGKCGDHWGIQFDLPSSGNWQRFTVRFSDPAFKQEGWGAPVPWNPRDVTTLQIQSVDKAESYDFWLDDIYLVR